MCEQFLQILVYHFAVGPRHGLSRWQLFSSFFFLFFSSGALYFPAPFSLLFPPPCAFNLTSLCAQSESFFFRFLLSSSPIYLSTPCIYSNQFLSLPLGFVLSPLHNCFDPQPFCLVVSISTLLHHHFPSVCRSRRCYLLGVLSLQSLGGCDSK